MLKKLLKMLNLGLFKNGTPEPIPFEPVTLVYAENGRGKSTLASLFRATGGFDTHHLTSIRTIDAAGDPALEMLFERDGAANRVAHSQGNWEGKKPDVFVFDPTFVEDNVYSGQEVRADQRQELLKFALGTETVHLEREVSRLTDEIASATKQRVETQRSALPPTLRPSLFLTSSLFRQTTKLRKRSKPFVADSRPRSTRQP